MQGPDTQNLENYGSDTFMGNNIPFQISGRQPEGSSISSQIQRRGSVHHFQWLIALFEPSGFFLLFNCICFSINRTRETWSLSGSSLWCSWFESPGSSSWVIYAGNGDWCTLIYVLCLFNIPFKYTIGCLVYVTTDKLALHPNYSHWGLQVPPAGFLIY